MKAALLVGPSRFEIRQINIPIPGRKEILVRVRACGVCMSEVSSWRGGDHRPVPGYPEVLEVMKWSFDEVHEAPYPRRWGHEMTGQVTAVGPGVTKFSLADEVTGLVGGAFTEYCVLPESRAVHLGATTNSESVFGEPIACAVNAARRARVNNGDAVVIIGTGFMSLMILQLVSRQSPRMIVAVDRRDDALRAALAHGADIAINSANASLHSQLSAALGPSGADVVIEGTGHGDALDLAGRIAGVRGRIVIVGFYRGERRKIDIELWNIKGLDVVNAHERDPREYMRGMREGVRLVEQGQLRVAQLVTHTFPLEAVQEAFATAEAKPDGFIKAAVQMPGEAT